MPEWNFFWEQYLFPEITRKIQCFSQTFSKEKLLEPSKTDFYFCLADFLPEGNFLGNFYEFIISFRTNAEKFWVVPLKKTYTLPEKWFGRFVPGKSPIVRCFSDFGKESARQCPQRWLFLSGKPFFFKVISIKTISDIEQG